MSDIPVSVPVFSVLQDDIDWILAEHQNIPNDEISALATLVGMLGVAQSHSVSFLTLLQNYKYRLYLKPKNTTSLTVAAGQIVISNAAGTIRKFRSKTTDTDIAAANLDSGVAFAANTAYNVFATADTGTTIPVFVISTSTSPSGSTFYRKLGAFRTDASANIIDDSITDVEDNTSSRYSKGYLYGGIISNDTTDPTNDLSISSVVCRDSTDTCNIKVPTLIKRIDATFVAGNNGGMLDTDVIGGSGVRVYLFAISDSTGVNQGDFLASKSRTSPTMPAGYDVKRLLGHRYWTGSAWALFNTSGIGVEKKVYLYSPVKVLNAGSATSFTDVDFSTYVDGAVSREIEINSYIVAGLAGAAVYIRPNGSSQAIATENMFFGEKGDASIEGAQTGCATIDANGVLEYAVSNGAVACDLCLRAYSESL